jgi:hypothetical protein
MRHDDKGTGVDGLKELGPGPSTHDGIHVDVDHGTSHIHYALVPLLPVTSNHVISVFQWARTSGLSSCQSQDN